MEGRQFHEDSAGAVFEDHEQRILVGHVEDFIEVNELQVKDEQQQKSAPVRERLLHAHRHSDRARHQDERRGKAHVWMIELFHDGHLPSDQRQWVPRLDPVPIFPFTR